MLFTLQPLMYSRDSTLVPGNAVPGPREGTLDVETMTDGSQFIDIILFAMVAVFLGLRLRSVLGRRTGHERPPAGLGGAPSGGMANPNNVVDMAQRRRPVQEVVEPSYGDPVIDAGLEQIRAADPNFTATGFLQGAKAAFEMIVQAFVRGDEAALRPLLSDEVFENFSAAVRSRRDAHETCETELVRINSTDLVEARMEDRTARLTVRFVSQQVIVVKDDQGKVVEGNPSRSVQITDMWSFARDTRSPNPNWLLVATRSHDE